jgi:hypothetical protein
MANSVLNIVLLVSLSFLIVFLLVNLLCCVMIVLKASASVQLS